MEWISVKEGELKPLIGRNLVYLYDHHCKIQSAYWNGLGWHFGFPSKDITESVTHWMPLPEPPKPQKP